MVSHFVPGPRRARLPSAVEEFGSFDTDPAEARQDRLIRAPGKAVEQDRADADGDAQRRRPIVMRRAAAHAA